MAVTPSCKTIALLTSLALQVLFFLRPAHAEPQLKILTFGGNGFIGSEVVDHLLTLGHDVTVVSRGNWYYDSAQRIKPRITRSFKCDRYVGCTSKKAFGRCEALEKCSDLMEFFESVEKFDYIIDFSAYSPSVIKNALRVLKDKIGLYIYISTDSVYEVSEEAEHDGPSLEGDAVRPSDVDASQQLADNDSYGSEKLGGEELLAAARSSSGGPPYVFLRLPDVFGPRDSTFRSWLYYLRLKYYHDIGDPVKISMDHSALETSLIYVGDVAKAVEAVMNAGKKVHDQAYNLGFKENFNNVRFIHDWSTIMGFKGVRTVVEAGDVQSLGFPSVTRGPVSIVKAQRELKFVPTKMIKAMEETANFYKDALVKYEKERNQVIEVFLDFFPDEKKQEQIMEILEKDLANNGVMWSRDEL